MMKYLSRLILLCSLTPALAVAEEDWWFDIEVIIFDRNVALSQLEEQFEYVESLTPTPARIDVISRYLHPDISRLKQTLPLCDAGSSPLWVPLPTLDQVIRDYASFQTEPVQVAQRQYINEPSPARPVYADNDLQQRQEIIAPAADLVDQVTPQKIASYWLEFLPLPVTEPVTVERIRFCEPDTPWLSWENGKWARYHPDHSRPYPDEMPVVLNGNDVADPERAHLLSSQHFELEKLSLQIRQARGLNRLLHAAWRQQVVFGENKANKVRIFAGKNYGNTFSLAGEQKTTDTVTSTLSSAMVASGNTDNEDFFVRLEQNLDQSRPVPFETMLAAVRENNSKTDVSPLDVHFASTVPIWQLEGYIKVFLKYINRVPYLHIDSEMFYRQPVPLDTKGQQDIQPRYQLRSVPFKQVRRVISKQLHYFDHPLFGMVIEIRRYQKPQEDEK